MGCKDCKYYETDYIWDGEDEEIIHYCSKHHKFRFLLRKGCKDYQKYIPQPYVEQFTECDKCKYLSGCNSVIDITMSNDTQRHFIRGINAYCKKSQGNLGDERLSEMLEMMNRKDKNGKFSFGDDKARQALKKAIEIYGDITYDEFITDYNKVHKVLNSF